ncbi:alkaline phosphatase family protein [Thermococcus stetteri]|uniref:alkaline phosphatase family protein n=1 Tax=Thermococcus stetteri TaxID=49900 RepID=UPI001AEA9220|nr:alkaline phosphatase family protein [Thermococcus stetteri]MBP1911659.1 putative AlkP superfamily phosphohydrolase/phosphomutase [Thermococcus stetteri]
MSPKVLIIGLDGATWDLIKPWADKGELPAFKKLMENGTWGGLESTIPPWTIPAWESMSTGKNPEKLGFATFMVKDGYKFIPHNFRHKRQKMIWDILSDSGRRAVVANLPNIYIAQKINGCMIAGWLYLDKERITYPANLINELNEHCNGYEVDIFDVDFEKGKITGGPKDEEYLKRCDRLLEKHFLAFKYLLQKCEWDFGFLVFVTTDRIQHKYWDDKILLEHYRKIDKKLEEILDTVDKETIVFLVSDHGFGPIKYTLNINEFLIKEGYLKLKKPRRQSPSKLLNLVKRSGLLPVARALVNLAPATLANRLKESVSSISFEKMDIDWSSTKAFAYAVLGDIYLNVKGREPNGIVGPDEYDKVREEIIEKIRNLEYKGRKLNIQVLRKEEVWPEASLWDNLPDLVIVPTDDGVQDINPNIGSGEIITESEGTKGNHRLYGILLAYGPGIKKGYEIEGAKIYDIAPTVLHVFGLPVPDDMDGRVLMEIFEPDSEFAKRKPKYVDPGYYEKKQEDEKLKKAIKNLKLKRKL